MSRRSSKNAGAGFVILAVLAFTLLSYVARYIGWPAVIVAVVVVAVLIGRHLIRKATLSTPKAQDLFVSLQNVRAMSGGQFEVFVAQVLRAMGYRTTVLGGSGDQGVDVIAAAQDGRVAIQCKNYNKPVGNKPVQEVYAGSRHHRCDKAWVVAPAGYTKGAYELAQSVGVRLFDASSIRKWIKQIDEAEKATTKKQHQPVAASEQLQPAAPQEQRVVDLDKKGTEQKKDTMAEDSKEKHTINVGTKDMIIENYWQLLEEYSEYLDHIEELSTIDTENNPHLEQEFVKVHQQLIDGVEELRRKLDILEGQNPELVRDKSATQRALLEERWKRVKGPKGEAIDTENGQKRVSEQQRNGGGQKKGAVTESNMEKHTLSVGADTVGETISFTAKLLGTAHVNGGKETKDGMDWTYYRLPGNTYRVLIDNGNTSLLLPSTFAEAWGRGEPAEYGQWTLEKLQNEGEYGRVFEELMKKHPEGMKRNVRDLD